jgi:hypothetical protein
MDDGKEEDRDGKQGGCRQVDDPVQPGLLYDRLPGHKMPRRIAHRRGVTMPLRPQNRPCVPSPDQYVIVALGEQEDEDDDGREAV